MVLASYAHEEIAVAPDKHCVGSNEAKGSGSRMVILGVILDSASSAGRCVNASDEGKGE